MVFKCCPHAVHKGSHGVHMLKRYKSEPSARSHPQHTHSNNNMKASLALSLLSLASTAFASAKVEEAEKPADPNNATPLVGQVPRQTTASDELLDRSNEAKFKLRFLLDHNLVKDGKDPLTMNVADYDKQLDEMVKTLTGDKLKEAVEKTATIIDEKYNDLFNIIGRVKLSDIVSNEWESIRKLAADAGKYKKYMELVARKDGPTQPTAEEIMEVLNMKPSPAIENSKTSYLYFLTKHEKFELNESDKTILKNQLLHFFEKLAFAKSLGEAELAKILTENKLPVSDKNTNILTLATKVESKDFFDIRAKVNNPAKDAAENNDQNSKNTAEASGSESMFTGKMIAIISVSVLALAIVGYFVIKRLGASDAEDHLDV